MINIISQIRRIGNGKRSIVSAAAVLLMLLCTLFLISCLSTDSVTVAVPDIPGAGFVGNETCSACHEQHVKEFSFTTHARLSVPNARMAGSTGCESCHGAGSLHVDDGTGKFIVNPGKSPQACFVCHLDKQAEFNLPFHHPVTEGKMNCTDCHDPHGNDIMKPRQIAIAGMNGTCSQCHKEQSMPYIFSHEALREGCVACHNPHGSFNKKMLVENDSNLCLKCHAQAHTDVNAVRIGRQNHTTRIPRGACWTAGCHTAIHGSNIDTHLRY